MHSSGVLGLKALASKIHPQLPLNPRESEQLLSMLTTSFRRQLDKEYPQLAGSGKTASATPPPKPGLPSLAPDNWSSKSVQTHAARHFKSVLQNPLFARGPHIHDRPVSRSSNKLPSVPRSTMGDAHQLFQDPVAWFEGHAAKGTATIGHAELCLQTLRDSMSTKSGAALRRAMKESEAGSKVVNWIWASGIENTNDFISTGALVYPLTQFLVEEGRWGVLLRWLRLPTNTTMTMENTSLEPLLEWRANLLQAVVEGQLKHESGQCTAAIQFFLRAASERETPSAIDQRMFGVAGRRIAQVLCSSETKLSATPQLYEDFISTIPVWTKRRSYYGAILSLHHPQNPDPMPAMAHIREFKELPLMRRYLNQQSTGRRREYVSFCFDLTRCLLRHGNHEDASMVLQFLKDQFPEELGVHNELSNEQAPRLHFSTRTKSYLPTSKPGADNHSLANHKWDDERRKKAEEANLHSLDSLALG